MNIFIGTSRFIYLLMGMLMLLLSCNDLQMDQGKMTIEDRLDQYTKFTLETNLTSLSENQKKMISLLIDAAKTMDEVFWIEAYGNKQQLLNFTSRTEEVQRFVEINYGPWDRLNGDEPFIEDLGPKPPGANFYPDNMSKQEFENWDSKAKDNLYTLVRRGEGGDLTTIPYHTAFSKQHNEASDKLKKAAELAADPVLKRYLNLRAEALLTDEYQASDLAWMDMKNNTIEVVIGPIETYEDRLYGYKAAHEAFVLIKDKEWSDRLAKYAKVLPKLQKELPVQDRYKQETPGRDSDLNAYDAVYYAGSANAGAKTIAINLPNDEEVQLKKGTRRLQLKNAMRAKYDKILLPISEVLLAQDQRQYLTFDAFFANTMFHEVAHGLGIKNTLANEETVREALKEHASALEEGKADVLGLYMIAKLRNTEMITDGSIKDNYVTFMTSIFRSIRFGSSSAHGKANLIRFNYFKEMNAFSFDSTSSTYQVNFNKMATATDSLSKKIITLQGDGDYEGVGKFIEKYGQTGVQLQQSLDRLSEESIPVDVIFKQGVNVLGLDSGQSK